MTVAATHASTDHVNLAAEDWRDDDCHQASVVASFYLDGFF